MTDTTTLAPTDAEILDAAEDFRSQYTHGGTTFDEFDEIGFARAILAKWGAPAPANGDTASPFGYFRAEPFGWTKCAESDEGARPLYEAPPVQEARVPLPKCWCRACRPITFDDMRFVVCPTCGNKRCPKANDHRNTCTDSNEPGQDGSAYPAMVCITAAQKEAP